MPINVVSRPDALALTKGGRMAYQFQGLGRVATQGSPARTVIRFSTAIADGTVLTLLWNGKRRSITFKTTPSAAVASEFPAGDGSVEYCRDILLPYFQTYFPFREDFSAGASDFGAYRGIVLDATKPGPAYNVTRVAGQAVAGAPVFPFIIETILVGAKAILRERYSVYVELWLQQSGNNAFTSVYSNFIETDESGYAQFDAGEILHRLLEQDLRLPDFSSNAPQRETGSARPYYICYGEAWGTPIAVGKIEKSPTYTAYLGGADFRHRASAGLDLVARLQAISRQEDRALRFGHLTRYVVPGQPEYLTFVNTRAQSVQAALHVRLLFDDQTGLTLTDLVDAFTFAPGQKWLVGVGALQLALGDHIPAGKSLQEYEVRLTVAGSDPGGNDHLSTAYRYVLYYSSSRYVRHFVYLNSLGSLDTLTTFGKGSAELDRFFEQAQRNLPYSYAPSDAQYVEYDLSLQQRVEVTTGFRDQGAVVLFNDFYRSPVRLRIKPGLAGTTEALQIGIVSKSIKLAKDGDRQFAHLFEYVYLHRDEFYTEDLEPQGDPAMPIDLIVAGSPVINLSTGPILNSVDHTVPNAARSLTDALLLSIKQLVGVGLHTAQGYLTQVLGDMRYFRKDTKIDYQQDLVNTPTTRDAAGLSDVLTEQETLLQTANFLNVLNGLRPRLTVWTSDVEPA
jgi:hypothetical protein